MLKNVSTPELRRSSSGSSFEGDCGFCDAVVTRGDEPHVISLAGCDCVYHRNCMISHLTGGNPDDAPETELKGTGRVGREAEEEAVIFPSRCGCNEVIDARDAGFVTSMTGGPAGPRSEAVFKAYAHSQRERECFDPLYCWAPLCRAFIDRHPRSRSHYAVCARPGCGRATCVRCGGDMHNGDCEPERQDWAFERLFAKLEMANEMQRCAACGNVYEFVDGCPEIECYCGNLFCFTCGGHIKTSSDAESDTGSKVNDMQLDECYCRSDRKPSPGPKLGIYPVRTLAPYRRLVDKRTCGHDGLFQPAPDEDVALVRCSLCYYICDDLFRKGYQCQKCNMVGYWDCFKAFRDGKAADGGEPELSGKDDGDPSYDTEDEERDEVLSETGENYEYDEEYESTPEETCENDGAMDVDDSSDNNTEVESSSSEAQL